MPKVGSAARVDNSAPILRRAYFDCRYGQLHVHLAIPGGGGFEEATALLCIPGSHGSGRVFQELMIPLGRDRSIYAVDLPGHGESDAPDGSVSAEALAAALLDFLDNMRLRRVDLLALHSGGAIALALTMARPAAVGRIALLGAGDPVRQALGRGTHPLQLFDAPEQSAVLLAGAIGAMMPAFREFLDRS